MLAFIYFWTVKKIINYTMCTNVCFDVYDIINNLILNKYLQNTTCKSCVLNQIHLSFSVWENILLIIIYKQTNFMISMK